MIRVQGWTFQVRDVGDQHPALVFLHYWGGTGRTWGLVIRELADRHRCVAPIFAAGAGRTRKRVTSICTPRLTTSPRSSPRWGCRSTSSSGSRWAGKIAQILGARRPNGLKGLVLVAAAPPVPIAAPKEQREAMLESYQSPAGVELALSILTSRQLSPELRQQVIDDTLGGSAAAKAAWTQAGMTLDISDIVGNIDVPPPSSSGMPTRSRPSHS